MSTKFYAASLLIVLCLATYGCRKTEVSASAPPAPAPVPAPTVAEPKPAVHPVVTKFTVEPSVIQHGQEVVVVWEVEGATGVAISPEIGAVGLSGHRTIRVDQSTAFNLHAISSAGSTSAWANVDVLRTIGDPPRTVNTGVVTVVDVPIDIFFDFNSSNLRPDAQQALIKNAEQLAVILRNHSAVQILIEGHCDDRGSSEFNLGLSDRRAMEVRAFLMQLRIPENRVSVISWGEEQPSCYEPNEECWQKNRRVHLSARRN